MPKTDVDVPVDTPPTGEKASGGDNYEVTLWMPCLALQQLHLAWKRRQSDRITVDQVFEELLIGGLPVAEVAIEGRLYRRRRFGVGRFALYKQLTWQYNPSIRHAADRLSSEEEDSFADALDTLQAPDQQQERYGAFVKCTFSISRTAGFAMEHFIQYHGYPAQNAFWDVLFAGCAAEIHRLYQKMPSGEFRSL